MRLPWENSRYFSPWEICRYQRRKFYISNNLKLALKLKLDGVYIPAFNKLRNYKNLLSTKNFEILGSAHNIIELKNKENQGCNEIFISPIFKTNKSNFFLETIKFNLIANASKKNVIALGGINKNNIKLLKLVNADGFAGITYFNKKKKFIMRCHKV